MIDGTAVSLELNSIINNSHTDDKYMDDEYEKENINDVFKKIMIKNEIKDEEDIKNAYSEMKDRTRASDTEIAKLLRINRSKLFRILKKKGIKK